MKRKILFGMLIGIFALVLVIEFLTPVIVEPFIKDKLQATLNEKYKDYTIEIGTIRFSLIPTHLELKKITIAPKQEFGGINNLNGEIESVKFKRIKLTKALVKKEFNISEIVIGNSNIKGTIAFQKKEKPPIVLHSTIHIGAVIFDNINLALVDSLTTKSFSANESALKLYDINIKKQDTLSFGVIKYFDFKAKELLSVSADSMYTYSLNDFDYSHTLNALSIKGLVVHPNYSEYDFTARYKVEKDRIEAKFSDIYLHNFPAEVYLKSGNLISSFIEIGKMDMHVFRDKRIADDHSIKPILQEVIYNFPGAIRIDSIGLKNAVINYKGHAEKANEPGSISFNKMKASIYNITNNAIYKTKDTMLVIKAEALLMNKGKLSILFKAKLFDKYNTFSLSGKLSGMEATAFNPILEKMAFVQITSGRIDAMTLNFRADNTKSTGQMTFLYHDLKLAKISKRTNDTSAFKEQFISFIANAIIIDSNPTQGNEIRIGIIDAERNPEKFIFNYWLRSALSGIQSTSVKNKKGKNKQ